MKDQTKIVEFGQICNNFIFVGMDVHKEKWVISISLGTKLLQTFSMEADVEQLIEKLLKQYGSAQIICAYEAGFCGFWLHRALEAVGIRCLVVHAADIPTTNKEQKRKNDKNDSRKIVHHLSRQSLESIYIPSEEQERLRGLTRVKSKTAQKKRQTMNRIRACFHRMATKIPVELKGKKLWTKKGEKWIEQVGKKNQNWELLEHLYDYRQYCQRLKGLKKQIVEKMQASSFALVYECLQTVYGIGWWIAALLITELGQINRFKNIDQLASYCGIVPDISASADKIKVKGLTHRANGRIRTALVQSAWIAIKYDPSLKKIYKEAVEAGKPKQKAIIKVTKKLLNRIRTIWKEEKKYYTVAVAG